MSNLFKRYVWISYGHPSNFEITCNSDVEFNTTFMKSASRYHLPSKIN